MEKFKLYYKYIKRTPNKEKEGYFDESHVLKRIDGYQKVKEAIKIAEDTFKEREDNRVYIPDELHSSIMKILCIPEELESFKMEEGVQILDKMIDNRIIRTWIDSNTQAYIFRPELFKEEDDKDLKEYQENKLKKKYT